MFWASINGAATTYKTRHSQGASTSVHWIALLKMVPIFSSSIRFHPFMKSLKRTTGRGDLRLLLLPPSKRDPSPRSPSHTDGFRFCERGSFPFPTIVFQFHDRMCQMEIERLWISKLFDRSSSILVSYPHWRRILVRSALNGVERCPQMSFLGGVDAPGVDSSSQESGIWTKH
ncbi:hypothetical protein AVEN_125217-1 [Araneus ventricosus]|uniref:Uncharacterized protein n=1 Tax=Araneus ventricosus TaxID=182803 RepID=A0A4Y2TIG6_ARAVE|nr:hypothetical protein AVEN_125217-1 [Araneus ventricosus]